MMRSRTGPGERGVSPAIEATLVIPAMVVLVGLVILLARGMIADQTVAAAASQAARAASIERSVASAESAALVALDSSLADAGTSCVERSVSVDASGLSAPIGVPASVRVHLTCRLEVGVTLPGLPATRTVSATGTSPVDTHRSR